MAAALSVADKTRMIRSTLFNIAFYGFTALACILCLPFLFLPKKDAMFAVRLFVHGAHFFEKYILGLDYEVRGREHLPASGSFIIAAKHESPYETTKLNILFDDPAIVLKRELLRIPLWGKFLAKVDPIAIDRSAGKEAMEQIIEGAKRIRDQGRPIVIFPQGTRVHTWVTTAERPYRIGVVKAALAAGLPVIPMALNSGMYWPRKSWLKHPGRVVFEFLPPLDMSQDTTSIMKELETRLETATKALHREAVEKYDAPVKTAA
jgi:1-acyl-sn-glycerol-3-phosphate acyltransferase